MEPGSLRKEAHMREDLTEREAPRAAEQPKRAYRRPEVRRLGALQDITRSNGALTTNDSLAAPSKGSGPGGN